MSKQRPALVVALALLAALSTSMLVGACKKSTVVEATPIPGTIQFAVDGEVLANLDAAILDSYPLIDFTLYSQAYKGIPLAELVRKQAPEAELKDSSVVRIVGSDQKEASITWGVLTTAKPSLNLVKGAGIYRMIGEAPGLDSQTAYIGQIVSIQVSTKG